MDDLIDAFDDMGISVDLNGSSNEKLFINWFCKNWMSIFLAHSLPPPLSPATFGENVTGKKIETPINTRWNSI